MWDVNFGRYLGAAGLPRCSLTMWDVNERNQYMKEVEKIVVL